MAAGYIFLVVLLLGVLYLLLIRPENRNAEMAVYRRTMFAHRGYHNKEKLIQWPHFGQQSLMAMV